MFAHCPLLSAFAVGGRHMQAFEEFLAYKNRIPVRGAIMLNEAMDSTVLVKGWKKGANWSFPRGKINKDEDDLICAIREVYEETGLDLEAAGLIPQDRNVKYIEVNIRDQQMRLYVFKNVPMSTHFEPRTRKEISKIEWWRLSDLPSFKKKSQQQETDPALNANKFYMVAPFLAPLRKWINQQKHTSNQNSTYQSTYVNQDEFLTEDDREDLGPQAPYRGSAPDATSVDDAGEMLSHLLHVQTTRSEPQQQSANTNSGSALLALLQSNPTNPGLSHPVPQTPLDQLVGAAPVPVTPHHHHTQRQATMLPPPPLFPIHPNGTNHAFQHQLPNFAHQSHQQQPQFYKQQPPQQPVFQPSPHHNQPQHLIHPQPLPPNVQKAVFAGGVAPSPPIPQSLQQTQPNWNAHLINSTTHAAAKNAVPPAHMLPDPRRQPLPQLNNHSMSLLNAFKSTGPSLGSAASQKPHHTQSNAAQRIPVVQELAADVTQPPGKVAVSSIMHSTTLQNPSSFMPRQEVSPARRSALLDMFKSPTMQNATALPVANTPSAVELSAVEPLSSMPKRSGKPPVEKRAHSGRLPELDQSTTQAFKPLSILARPEAARVDVSLSTSKTTQVSPTQLPERHNVQGADKSVKQPQPVADRAFAPQILKRPQAGETIDVTTIFKSPSSNASILPSMSPAVGSAKVGRDAAPQHKQNLLSLFGKVPSNTSSTGQISPAPMVSRTSTLDLFSTVSPMETSSRSRMDSIVSAEALSRRGSASTMSKANENFLLGYLDAVAGGSKR